MHRYLLPSMRRGKTETTTVIRSWARESRARFPNDADVAGGITDALKEARMGVSPDGTGFSPVSFLKATIVGGLLFLLPLILVVVLLGHAIRLAGKAIRPVLEFLKLDTVVGSGGEMALTVLALILI